VTKKRLDFLDIVYLALMILPIVAGIVLKVLTKPLSEGISVTGAQIYFTVPMPIQDLPITEAQINSWLVILVVLGLCLFLTRKLKTRDISVRQIVAEWLVEKADGLIKNSMGEYFMGFSSFIAAILGLSAFSSLLSLFGLFPPTSDINVTAGWAILVFVLITYYKNKCGPVHYLKSLADPILLTPLNVISEIATPVSMAFRHYGNVLSGTVISVLVATGLQGLSKLLLGWLPGVLGEIPFLQVGIPAVLSIYFDVFSGLLQAYIFAMLTMMYVSGGFPLEEYLAKKKKKKQQMGG
jgi:F-type H+-transporting ATPase subunit a